MTTMSCPIILGSTNPARDQILTHGAMNFVAALTREYRHRISALLNQRSITQAELTAGNNLDFLPETANIRHGNWQIAPIPADLLRRHVEITGPVERKMIINALNSGADVFMADFEDSSAPTWANQIDGQINLRDAVAGTITYKQPDGNKIYRLNEETATLMVRPRGLHLWEKHIRIDGMPVPASLFDFGLFFFHNAHALVEQGSAPYFYLPKLESHVEARLWNDVFVAAQKALNIPVGTIRATVLIETIPAAFEMDEILYELRAHSAGLNCGRWDYIFSYIKKHAHRPDFVMPDRGQVGMNQPFMHAYSRLLIKTCHRRGAHAMGGMAAQIPIKDDPEQNEIALKKVKCDKLREVKAGHDGTWVAHPGLINLVRQIFDEHLNGPHQIWRSLDDVDVHAEQLLACPTGTCTMDGLRLNIRIGIQYLEAWLQGRGCVPLYNLMEDAATAEISRAQLWQWIRHSVRLESGETVTPGLFNDIVQDEMMAFDGGKFDEAAFLFQALCKTSVFIPFLTLFAYESIVEIN